MEKTYFTIKEALEDIKEHLVHLDNLEDLEISELHDEVFNTDYYIIGTYKAEKALEQYGVFNALREVQEYEMDHFGEVLTDITDPEQFATMLYYIKGYETLETLEETTEIDLYDPEEADKEELLKDLNNLIQSL